MTLAEMIRQRAAVGDTIAALKPKLDADDCGPDTIAAFDAAKAEFDTLTANIEQAQAEAAQRQERIAAADAVKAQLDAPASYPVTSPGRRNLSIQVGEDVADKAGWAGFEANDKFAGSDSYRNLAPEARYALAVVRAARPGQFANDPGVRHLQSSMSLNTGADGGFAAPKVMADRIMTEALFGDQAIAGYVQNWPLTGAGEIEVPGVSAGDNTAGVGIAGGAEFKWRAENATRDNDSPKLYNVKLNPHEGDVYMKVPNRLLSAAPALGTLLTQVAPRAATFAINEAIINGDGAGKPLGMLTSGAGSRGYVSVAKKASQAADTVVVENLFAMVSALLPSMTPGAFWIINPHVRGQLQGLTLGNYPVYLPNGTVRGGVPVDTLLNLPVVVSESAAALGDAGDVILCGRAAYYVSTRRNGEFESSVHVHFDTAQTAFRLTVDIDGQPSMDKVYTPKKGAALGGIVTVAVRS